VEWQSSLPIEIELIAWGGREGAGEPLDYLTPTGMKASPVYSRVVRVNDGKLIYLSSVFGKTDGHVPIQSKRPGGAMLFGRSERDDDGVAAAEV